VRILMRAGCVADWRDIADLERYDVAAT